VAPPAAMSGKGTLGLLARVINQGYHSRVIRVSY